MPGTLIKRWEYDGGASFEILVYDLLAAPVDAIVNAANGGLSHGGGVAAAIATAAGPDFDDECRDLIRQQGRVAVGEAVATSAGRLPYKGVIHAVGPRMGDGDEGLKIGRALLSAFRRADEQGWTSVAFPAISSGIFSVPPSICAKAYLRAVETFFQQHPETTVKLIILCLFKGPVLDEIKKGLTQC